MSQRLSQVQRGLALLREVQQQDALNLRACRTVHGPNSDNESKDESPSPIMDKFLDEGTPNAIKNVTEVLYLKCNSIYDLLELEVFSEWIAGNGNKHRLVLRIIFSSF